MDAREELKQLRAELKTLPEYMSLYSKEDMAKYERIQARIEELEPDARRLGEIARRKRIEAMEEKRLETIEALEVRLDAFLQAPRDYDVSDLAVPEFRHRFEAYVGERMRPAWFDYAMYRRGYTKKMKRVTNGGGYVTSAYVRIHPDA